MNKNQKIIEVQITSGRFQQVDTSHRLAGKRGIKRHGMLRGCEIKILGIRVGMTDSGRYAFVAQYGCNTFLISRRDFKMI